ncbi:MAG: PilZ domain-containing protein [Candidatus Omnitrophica bacterium]|nr:PilZ domain-containing protein [Candidatus Omnitrophota bacterium]
MFLMVELIIIIVLISASVALFIEEAGIKKSAVPCGVVTEYWDGEERRKTIRVNTELFVRYSVQKKLHMKLNGEIKDLSRKGMRLAVNERLSDETLLLLEFNIPEAEQTIAADGKVMWTSGDFGERDGFGKRVFQTGVQFMNIRPEDDTKLTAYINKIAKKQIL